MEIVYFAIDNEASGKQLGVHDALSFGAAPLLRHDLTLAQYEERGLVFYAEVQPENPTAYDPEAMRVGCLHLQCLEGIRETDKRFDPTHEDFDPGLVLLFMQEHCEDPGEAAERFRDWVWNIADGREIKGLTDTVFFDSGFFNLWLGTTGGNSPFGHAGIDLNSLHRGYARNPAAHLKDLRVPDPRNKPHRADQDAVLLAHVGKKLLYDTLGW